MFLSFKLVILGLILSCVAGGYLYVTALQNKLETTADNLATATLNQATLEKDIGAQKIDIEKLNQEISALDKKFNKINSSGKKRDIGNLALARTKTIERVINTASSNALRCLEIATGAKLTTKEINATKKSQINPECPSIANPNYINY